MILLTEIALPKSIIKFMRIYFNHFTGLNYNSIIHFNFKKIAIINHVEFPLDSTLSKADLSLL
jgi:hypothetical protein